MARMVRLVVEFEKLSHLGNPALLDEGGVIRVIAVASVGGGIGELHGQAKGEVVLAARLAQALETLHAGKGGERTGSLEEIALGGGAGRVFETKGDSVANHAGPHRTLAEARFSK